MWANANDSARDVPVAAALLRKIKTWKKNCSPTYIAVDINEYK
jgi:hypothetical protein